MSVQVSVNVMRSVTTHECPLFKYFCKPAYEPSGSKPAALLQKQNCGSTIRRLCCSTFSVIFMTCNTCFSTVLPSTTGSAKWSFPLIFCD